MTSWQKYTIYILPVILVASLLYFFGDIVSYIVIAWVVAMMGDPIHSFLSKSKYISKNMAAGLTLLLFAMGILLFVRLIVPPLFAQAKNLAGLDYEKMISGLEEPIADSRAWLEDKGLLHTELTEDLEENILQEKLVEAEIIKLDSLLRSQGDSTVTGINLVINVNNPDEDLEEDPNGYLEGVKNNIFELFNPARIPKLIGSFFGFFGNILITILSVFFIAFFFLKEKGLFTKMVSFLVPNGMEGKSSHAIEESSNLLARYFVGLLVQATIILLITTLVLKLLGIKSALLMAFCFAIFNLIPYIGPILGNLFGVLIVVSSNLELGFYDEMLPMIIKTVVVFGVMQLVDNFIVQPNIFSRSVKAHPLEIFLVVLMGAKIGGIAGMVVAIPAYTVLRVLAKVFLSEFEIVKKFTANM